MAADVGEAVIKLTLAGDLEKQASKVTGNLSSGFSKWSVTVGSLVASGISKAVDMVSNSLGSAISRVDTLRNANKMFEAMGYSADSTAKSIDFLKNYLDGLPTSLDSAIGGVQKLSASFGGIEIGTQAFKAMNNAGLAFGATSDQISNAITQLSQTSLTGPLDAATWNSLMNSGFSPVFSAMAKEAGMTVGELKTDFGGRGTKTVQDFLNMLIKLDNEGSGSMKSLSEMARENTNGIGTALENVSNRASKAVGQVIESLGSENIANAINEFSSKFTDIANAVVEGIKWIGDNAGWLVPLVGGLATAFLTFNTVMKVITVTQAAFNAVMMMNPVVLIIAAVVGLIAAIILLWNNCEGFRNFILGALEKIGQFFSWVGEKVGEIANNVIGFFIGIGQKAFEIFNTITSALGSFFAKVGEIIGNVVNVIAMPFKVLWDIVSGIFIAIAAVLAIAAEWVYNTVLAPIIDFAINAFITIGNFIFGVFDNVKSFFVNLVTWFNNTILTPIGNFFNSAFSAIGNAVSAVANQIKSVFDGVKNFISNIVNNIKGFFSGLWNGITAGVQGIKSTFQSVFSTIAGIIKAPINGIISAINNVIGEINSISVPDWVPGIGGASPNIPIIPMLASGGLAYGATTAVIGEAGAEAVLPLERNTGNWSGLLADTLLDEIELRDNTTGLGDRPIVVNNYINNEMDADDIGRRLMTSIRRAA